jgi:hypothetical protein
MSATLFRPVALGSGRLRLAAQTSQRDQRIVLGGVCPTQPRGLRDVASGSLSDRANSGVSDDGAKSGCLIQQLINKLAASLEARNLSCYMRWNPSCSTSTSSSQKATETTTTSASHRAQTIVCRNTMLARIRLLLRLYPGDLQAFSASLQRKRPDVSNATSKVVPAELFSGVTFLMSGSVTGSDGTDLGILK